MNIALECDAWANFFPKRARKQWVLQVLICCKCLQQHCSHICRCSCVMILMRKACCRSGRLLDIDPNSASSLVPAQSKEHLASPDSDNKRTVVGVDHRQQQAQADAAAAAQRGQGHAPACRCGCVPQHVKSLFEMAALRAKSVERYLLQLCFWFISYCCLCGRCLIARNTYAPLALLGTAKRLRENVSIVRELPRVQRQAFNLLWPNESNLDCSSISNPSTPARAPKNTRHSRRCPEHFR